MERILRTTTYSAFLVVTPVEPEHVPERPKKVQDVHTPQLYKYPFTRSGEWTLSGEETDQGKSMGVYTSFLAQFGVMYLLFFSAILLTLCKVKHFENNLARW